MRLIDLSQSISANVPDIFSSRTKEVMLSIKNITYTGLVHKFSMRSMAGTYLDLPGHIKEADDGYDMRNYPPEKLYRLKTAVIHLERKNRSGAVHAEDLKAAFSSDLQDCRCMIINALGSERFDSIEFRTVYLASDAVDWITNSGISMLVSDIYESQNSHGVFRDLFSAGISTVCCPINMHLIDNEFCYTSVFPLPLANVTQMPCRVLAEL